MTWPSDKPYASSDLLDQPEAGGRHPSTGNGDLPDDGYTGRRRLRAPGVVRRWPRRLLVGTNVVVAVLLVATGSVYGYVTWRFGQIKKISVPSLGSHAAAGAGNPMTILVVGSDSRAGITGAEAKAFGNSSQVAGQRSDTIILVRINPKNNTASIMSIPRDLWVPIPGKNFSQRINTTFDTGPDLLVRAIQTDLGIQVDHFVQVNFDTFQQIVNAVGGVKQYFPTPARDAFSNLVIPAAGCYNLTGAQALQFVRSRHYEYNTGGRWHFEAESDLARIKRQQAFIKKMISKAQSSGLTNPLKLNSIVSGITTNLTVDKGLSQQDMLNLAKRFRSFSAGSLPSATLPTTPAVIAGNDVLQLKQPDAQTAITSFLGQPQEGTPAAPPAVTNVKPADVRVSVLNGTGRTGQAGQTATALRNEGYTVTSTGTSPTHSNPTTVIRYGPGADAKAALLARSVVGGAQIQADATVKGADVVLVTGQSYSGIQPPGTAAPATTTTPAAPASTAPAAAPPTTAPLLLPGAPAGFVEPPC